MRDGGRGSNKGPFLVDKHSHDLRGWMVGIVDR